MKIMDFLSKKAVVTDLKSAKKEDILRELLMPWLVLVRLKNATATNSLKH